MTDRERFETFWTAYPRRVGKLAAERIFVRQRVTDELLERMLAALAWQLESDQWRQGFIPHPRTWLHQGRWLDEPDPPRALTARELEEGKAVLRRLGACPHDPVHTNWRECVRAIVVGRV